MDYQIIVISEMHHDARGNVVKGVAPKYRFLWCDSNNFIVGGRRNIWHAIKGRSTIEVENRWSITSGNLNLNFATILTLTHAPSIFNNFLQCKSIVSLFVCLFSLSLPCTVQWILLVFHIKKYTYLFNVRPANIVKWEIGRKFFIQTKKS